MNGSRNSERRNKMRREAIHNGTTVFVLDMTQIGYGTITAYTENGSVAELSENPVPIKGLVEPLYYFNRIKVRLENEGKGEGKALMIEICKLVDELKITIYNELNPYGKRNMESLKSFFKASGFEDFINDWNDPNVMIRRPQPLVEGESNDKTR
jgi:hypothetical protein